MGTPQGNTIPLALVFCFFFFLSEGPLPLFSHESLPASCRRPILTGKLHPHEGLMTWIRLRSLASLQISSLNHSVYPTGHFLGLRSGRVVVSKGENSLILLAPGSGMSLGLPDNGFSSKIPLWEVPEFLVLLSLWPARIGRSISLTWLLSGGEAQVSKGR